MCVESRRRLHGGGQTYGMIALSRGVLENLTPDISSSLAVQQLVEYTAQTRLSSEPDDARTAALRADCRPPLVAACTKKTCLHGGTLIPLNCLDFSGHGLRF